MIFKNHRNTELQPRDWDTLRPLCYCYRITTARIEAERRWGCTESTARKRLKRLCAGGFLNRLSVLAAEMPPLMAPLLDWTYGEPVPRLGAIATLTAARWKHRPMRKTTVYIASDKTLLLEALEPREKLKKDTATHELGVQATYEFCRTQFPELTFVGEELFRPERGHGEKCEDSQLLDERGQLVAIADFLGAYRRPRLVELIELTAEHSEAAGHPVRLLGF